MAYCVHEIGSLIPVRPREARALILKAFVESRASRKAAASLIGCRRSTFMEWIRKLGMQEELRVVERIAKRDGWHHGRFGGEAWLWSKKEISTKR